MKDFDRDSDSDRKIKSIKDLENELFSLADVSAKATYEGINEVVNRSIKARQDTLSTLTEGSQMYIAEEAKLSTLLALRIWINTKVNELNRKLKD